MSDETMISARKILILSANPRNTDRLRLDEEVREIRDRLNRAKYGRQFIVQQATAVRIRDLQQELLEHEPDIVHFCGHSETEGLLLENNQGEAVLVPSDGLASLFDLCSQHVECVLLNSCHSSHQAEVISQHIPYVIGMNREVFDDAAVEFAGGLYAALGAGRNIEESFEFGRNALKLHDLPDELTPILLKQKVVTNPSKDPTVKKEDDTASSARPSVSASVAVKPNLPERLITARQENKLIPIVGAGVSMSLKDESGERLFPGWDQLLEYAADALEKEGKTDYANGIKAMLALKKFQDAADLANEGLTGRLWTEFFKKYIEEPLDRAPDDTFALPKVVWEISNRVITLNYDKVLRIACPNLRRLKELDNSNQAGLADFKSNNDTPMVWHLHGRTDNISTLIFTAESYSRLYTETDANYQAALDLFKDLCRDNHLLFVGCRLEDAELLQVMAGQHKLFGENTGPHYALVREKHKAEISRRLDGMPLELLTFEDFGEPLLKLVQAIAGPKQTENTRKKSIKTRGMINLQYPDTGEPYQKFDVFLCHNSQDKDEVRNLNKWLKQKGIITWLDEEQLPPGRPWQDLLECHIKSIRTAAICVGGAGVGPWQDIEIRAFLHEFVRRKIPVIPVILPTSQTVPQLPLFLRQFTWVDFREEAPDPLSLLLWGITGKRK